jgi:signal transduction histidine kinase
MINETLTVLIVDDDEDDFILTRDILYDYPYLNFSVAWSDNAADALPKMIGNDYDIFLVDYRLGAEDGIKLLRDAINGGCQSAIIILTGQGDDKVDIESMRIGAADYLVKGELDGANLARSMRYAYQQKQTEASIREMRQRLTDSRESERLAMAQDLHDGPLQDLMGVQFNLHSLSRSSSPERTAHQLSLVQGGLNRVIDTLREMCREMRPPSLAPFGLARAIQAHAQLFQESYPLHLELDLDEDEQILPEKMRMALYRIYQHGVSNVWKHAHAQTCWVTFRLNPDAVVLEIRDNGRGFQVPKNWLIMAREGHFGLVGAMERAEAFAGKLLIKSEENAGTTLQVTLPVPPNGQSPTPY